MIHVYQIPTKRSDGFVFHEGKPIEFLNVDWFSSPELLIRTDELNIFLRERPYMKAAKNGTRFLVLCDDHPSLTFQIIAGPQDAHS